MRCLSVLPMLGLAGASAAANVAANCPATVTSDEISNHCVQNTATNCPSACRDLIIAANTRPNCVTALVDSGVSHGFSEELFCNMLTGPCKINSLTGLSCPKPPMIDAAEYFFKFNLPAPPKTLDTDTFELAIADSLNVPWADVNVPDKTDSSRRLASGSVEVQVFSESKANSDALVLDVSKPAFVTKMETKLTKAGMPAGTYNARPTGVESTAKEPPMGGYVVPIYKPSAAVTTLHGYSPMKKGEKWNSDLDSKEGEEYMTNIAAVSVSSMIIIFVFIIFYWIFLCGHNCNCCKKCCKCCNQKGAYGGATMARVVISVFYLITIITMCTSLTGRNHFQDGLGTVRNVLSNTSNIFTDLEQGTADLSAAASKFEGAIDLTKTITPPPPTGPGCKDTTAYDSFKGVAKEMTAASKDASDKFDGIGEDLLDMQKSLLDGSEMLDNFLKATVALVVLWALFGLIGVLLGRKMPRMSDCCINFGTFIGIMVLIVLAVLITVELAMGVFLADFCHDGPLINVVTAIKTHMDGDNVDMLSFYLDCANGAGDIKNPVTPSLVEARSLSTTAGISFKSLGNSGQCSDVTMKTVYGTGGSVEMTNAALDGVITSLSCATINPLFVEFTHTGLCGFTVDGLLSIFQTHCAVCGLMLFTLMYASFVRPYMNSISYKDARAAAAGNKVDPGLSPIAPSSK